MTSPLLAALRRRLPTHERLVIFRSPATTDGADILARLGFEVVPATDLLLASIEGIRQRHQIDPLRALLRRGLPGTVVLKAGHFAAHAFLAAATDAPARFGGVWLYPGEMAINALFVAPEFRGAGLGRALHGHVVADAVQRYGSHTNIAWTADSNLSSQRMLIGHGCVRIGTLDRWLVWHRPVYARYRGEAPAR